MTHERGNGLRAAAAARSADATERARSALVDLHKRGETITFAGVATRASVSREFLYSHSELRPEIERLRGEPRPVPARLPSGEHASDGSIRTRLRAALDENKRLRAEIAELRDELALTHGRVRELELAKRAVTQGLNDPATGLPTTDNGASFIADMSATREPQHQAESA